MQENTVMLLRCFSRAIRSTARVYIALGGPKYSSTSSSISIFEFRTESTSESEPESTLRALASLNELCMYLGLALLESTRIPLIKANLPALYCDLVVTGMAIDVTNVAYQMVGGYGVFGNDKDRIYIRVVRQLNV